MEGGTQLGRGGFGEEEGEGEEEEEEETRGAPLAAVISCGVNAVLFDPRGTFLERFDA